MAVRVGVASEAGVGGDAPAAVLLGVGIGDRLVRVVGPEGFVHVATCDPGALDGSAGNDTPLIGGTEDVV